MRHLGNDASWGNLGPSKDGLGVLLGRLRASCGPLGRPLGVLRRLVAVLGRLEIYACAPGANGRERRDLLLGSFTISRIIIRIYTRT